LLLRQKLTKEFSSSRKQKEDEERKKREAELSLQRAQMEEITRKKEEKRLFSPLKEQR